MAGLLFSRVVVFQRLVREATMTAKRRYHVNTSFRYFRGGFYDSGFSDYIVQMHIIYQCSERNGMEWKWKKMKSKLILLRKCFIQFDGIAGICRQSINKCSLVCSLVRALYLMVVSSAMIFAFRNFLHRTN